MKRSVWSVAVLALLIMAWTLGRVQGQQEGRVLFVDSAKASYSPAGDTAGVLAVPLWGHANSGAHATFSKFAPGYDAGVHIHTNDVWLVVVKGAYLYKDEDGEKRVGVGDFIRIPGGHKHWSGGDKKEGALFYEESSGKFDLIPAR